MQDNSFKDFVIDQLSALPHLRVQRMFGGHGFYAADKFFAILMSGRLYFKTDEHTRELYIQRGMEPFIYKKARQTLTMRYYEVPPAVLEDRKQLLEWARQAIRASGRDARD